ncbi:sensor histidine kinase [Luteimonas aestuarii]|uniref:Sensor histidine kinase n=2 Tax=Luteimonas aestuarii TaxID=453837 RepID=A0A4V3ALN9_9GAMM|nr:sensor histidine kinase [Luteimonas aestuarii]
MHTFRALLFNPMHIALLLTWLAVALALSDNVGHNATLAWALMGAFLVAALLTRPEPEAPKWPAAALLAIQIACGLGLVVIDPRSGTMPVLLVVVAAQLGVGWPLRTCLVVLLLVDLALYLVMRDATHHSRALFTVMIYGGFQGFALLVGHYARTAEKARDALSLVNADLLATRALLADSARDNERLRVARELHDVAGHKLTALKLNLRALAVDPALQARDDVRVAQQLSTELLDDIRGVVQAIRDTRGLDLDTALRALASPLPKLQLDLRIDHDVQVTDPAQAETVLRLVQEALTNAARHAGASRVSVTIARAVNGIDLAIEDDGVLRGPLREGNGLSGMRERVAAARGRFDLGRTAGGGLSIHASLPA